jgi:hypothetical protein
VTYYYDGANVGCVSSNGGSCQTSTITGAPMYAILVASTSNGNVPSAITERFDYVRVWQH